MKNYILNAIDDKSDYLTVLEAVTGTKTAFTEEEKEVLLAAYSDKAGNKFGFTNGELLKALLVLDTAPDKSDPAGSPLAGDLPQADLDALCALTALCGDWEGAPEKALAAKNSALSEEVGAPLALALARAALDVLAGKRDIAAYRNDIAALAAFLSRADDELFHDASQFLVRVQARM